MFETFVESETVVAESLVKLWISIQLSLEDCLFFFFTYVFAYAILFTSWVDDPHFDGLPGPLGCQTRSLNAIISLSPTVIPEGSTQVWSGYYTNTVGYDNRRITKSPAECGLIIGQRRKRCACTRAEGDDQVHVDVSSCLFFRGRFMN